MPDVGRRCMGRGGQQPGNRPVSACDPGAGTEAQRRVRQALPGAAVCGRSAPAAYRPGGVFPSRPCYGSVGKQMRQPAMPLLRVSWPELARKFGTLHAGSSDVVGGRASPAHDTGAVIRPWSIRLFPHEPYASVSACSANPAGSKPGRPAATAARGRLPQVRRSSAGVRFRIRASGRDRRG
jgi:hypothetical protein